MKRKAAKRRVTTKAKRRASSPAQAKRAHPSRRHMAPVRAAGPRLPVPASGPGRAVRAAQPTQAVPGGLDSEEASAIAFADDAEDADRDAALFDADVILTDDDDGESENGDIYGFPEQSLPGRIFDRIFPQSSQARRGR